MKKFEWEKLGKIFNPTEHTDFDWMREYTQAPYTLIFDHFVRIYFSCRPYHDKEGQAITYVGFIDVEKNNLFKIINISKKPVISLGGIGDFDEFGTMPLSVIREKDRLFGYYGGWTRCSSVPFNVAIGLVESFDNGVSFTKKFRGPIISYSYDEPFVLGVPRIKIFDNKWYLFYNAGKKWKYVDGRPEVVYKIRMAISDDGISWNKINRDLLVDILGLDEAQASPDVFFKDGIYHMFFCYRFTSDFRDNSSRGYRIGYAYSIDLISWIRDDSKAGLNVSETGWDSKMVSFPHTFELNDDFYMLYIGNEFGKEGFGIAKLQKKIK